MQVTAGDYHTQRMSRSCLPVEEEAAAGLDPVDDVLGNAHRREQLERLVHHAQPGVDRVERAGRSLPEKLHRGSTWTTDAPYRETEAAISRARDLGTLAVEMEAAALYAFGATSGKSIVCFAHVTNAMAQTEGDFEKGEADGAKATLAVVAAAARGWRSSGS